MHSAADLEQTTLTLLWSLWSELGVPGAERLHANLVIDPEPLVVWTPWLANGDARLLQLAFDWCASHASWLSAARIKGLSNELPAEGRADLLHFLGSLENAGHRFRPSQSSEKFKVDRRTMALRIERPALLRFRLRAVCGSGLRADVLALLLENADKKNLIRDLIPSGSSRRTVERVIFDLSSAGFVTAIGDERPRAFRLQNPKAWLAMMGAASLRWIGWMPVFHLIALGRRQVALSRKSETIQTVESQKIFREVIKIWNDLGWVPPTLQLRQESAPDDLLSWVCDMLESMAE